jgi:hypothetical protein
MPSNNSATSSSATEVSALTSTAGVLSEGTAPPFSLAGTLSLGNTSQGRYSLRSRGVNSVSKYKPTSQLRSESSLSIASQRTRGAGSKRGTVPWTIQTASGSTRKTYSKGSRSTRASSKKGPSATLSTRKSAASVKPKHKSILWDTSDPNIFDRNGNVIKFYDIDKDFFKSWMVSCNATLRPAPSGRNNTERLLHVRFMVKPPSKYMPPGSSKEVQDDRIRFQINLGQDRVSKLRNGDEVTQDEVAKEITGRQQNSRLRVDPRVPRLELFGWATKSVNWRMVPEQGKYCGVR